jgi:hypothetical protein
VKSDFDGSGQLLDNNEIKILLLLGSIEHLYIELIREYRRIQCDSFIQELGLFTIGLVSEKDVTSLEYKILLDLQDNLRDELELTYKISMDWDDEPDE